MKKVLLAGERMVIKAMIPLDAGLGGIGLTALLYELDEAQSYIDKGAKLPDVYQAQYGNLTVTDTDTNKDES